jgi:hypothetical protein
LQELAAASQRLTAGFNVFRHPVEAGPDGRSHKLRASDTGGGQDRLRQRTRLRQLVLDQVPDAVGDTRGDGFQIALQGPFAALHTEEPLAHQCLYHSD